MFYFLNLLLLFFRNWVHLACSGQWSFEQMLRYSNDYWYWQYYILSDMQPYLHECVMNYFLNKKVFQKQFRCVEILSGCYDLLLGIHLSLPSQSCGHKKPFHLLYSSGCLVCMAVLCSWADVSWVVTQCIASWYLLTLSI